VTRAGLYRGKLWFWAAGSDEKKALEVPINLEIGSRPSLALLGSAPQWNLVQCEWQWVCWLARQIVYPSATQDAQSFKIENQSALPAERVDTLTLLRGTNNRSNDAANDVTIKAPEIIRAIGNADVQVIVDRHQLDADAYEGSVRIRTPGTDEALTIPLLVNVRNGPIVPLVLIFAGIIVGRWARELESPEIKAQMKALQRFYVIRFNIARVRHATSVQFLTTEADDIERQVENNSATEQKMTEELTHFEAQIDYLARLDALEIDVAAIKIPDLSTAISADIAAARIAFIKGDEAAAQKFFDDAKKKISDEASKAAPMLSTGTPNVVPSVLLSLVDPVGGPVAPRTPPVKSAILQDSSLSYLAIRRSEPRCAIG
jgi:hypothetical protein